MGASQSTARDRRIRSRGEILIVALVSFALVAGTVSDPGLTWDEGIYLGFAYKYTSWFAELSSNALASQSLKEQSWQGQAHPPLGKLISAACMRALGWIANPIIAARFGAAAVYAALCAALYAFLRRNYGKTAALAGGASLIITPRLFAHAHFAALDLPTALFWTLTTFAFARGIESRRWSVVTGFLFGLGLLTKVNAVFLPPILVTWGLVFHGRKSVPNIVALALIGPATFFIGWPALWHHPVGTTSAYVADKMKRMIVPTQYFGRVYRSAYPSWHYPFVMTLITSPPALMVCAAVGIGAGVRRMKRRSEGSHLDALLIMSFFGMLLLAALPSVPRYDGIRLFLPASVFLAALSGVGVSAMLQRWRGKAAHWFLLAVFMVQAVPLILMHPYQLGYYNLLVGGPWGARKLGMETTYWGEGFDRRAADFINERTPKGGSIAIEAFGSRILPWYKVTGTIRDDIYTSYFKDMKWSCAVVQPRRAWLEPEVEAYMKSHEADFVNWLTPLRRIPVCMVYLNRERDTLPP